MWLLKWMKNRIRSILLIVLLVVCIVLLIDNSSSFIKRMYPVKYKEYVQQYAAANRLDPYLVFAVIKAESSFNPKAISHRGAKGLMQLTDATGTWGAEKLGITDFDPQALYDPETNIRIGCWYLGWLMDAFNGNMQLVTAAYNAGNGNVRMWLQDKRYSSDGQFLDHIPFGETERFVKRVKNNREMYRRLYTADVPA